MNDETENQEITETTENEPSENPADNPETVTDDSDSGQDDSGGGNDSDSGNDSDGGGDNPETVTDDSETIAQEEPEKIQLVYIGPSLTFEKLRTSQILLGTQEEINAFMFPITQKYPETVHLLVPPESLHAAMRKVNSPNSILYKYYHDMLAKSRDIRKG